MIPYKAIVQQAPDGAKVNGIWLRWYELKLYGGLMKAQVPKARKNKAFVLARRTNANMLGDGPKWMHDMAREINGLETFNPEKLLAYLQQQKQSNPNGRNNCCIVCPSLEDLGGMIEE